LFGGQSLELGGEDLPLACVRNVSLMQRKPPLKGPVMFVIMGALLAAIGATMGAQGIAITLSGIPWLLLGCRGVATQRPQTVLVIAADDGRTRVIFSSDSETLERLAHELRQRIGREHMPDANRVLALA
jgi:hypothetical protein